MKKALRLFHRLRAFSELASPARFERAAFRLGVELSVSYRMVRGVLKYRKILDNQHFWSNFVLCGGARYCAVLASFGVKSDPVLATLLAHFISHTLIQACQRAFQMLWFNLEYAARGNVERQSLLFYIHLLQFAKSHLAEITTPLHLMLEYLSDRTPVIIVPCVKEYIFSVSQNSSDWSVVQLLKKDCRNIVIKTQAFQKNVSEIYSSLIIACRQ